MKPADVERATHELTRLKEIEGALRVVVETGYFTVRAIGKDHAAGPAEFLHLGGGRKEGYGGLITKTGLAEVKAVVIGAYEAEAAAIRARLAKLGIEVEEAKAA